LGTIIECEVRAAMRVSMNVTIIGAGNRGVASATGWWQADTT
jgi:hypothetical protein